MKINGYILGIDTSNYKTSLAVTDRAGNVICDFREFLKVRRGEKGLRQSDAVFQHVKTLPLLMERARKSFSGEFDAIAYSSRPRPVEGSYMPVFVAGEGFARMMSSALKVPLFAFSHQEGHIEAVKAYSALREKKSFIACHFSGGTCEVLEVNESASANVIYDIRIVGGAKDISFGQVIDRAGVMMGYDFPAGEFLDDLAAGASESTDLLTKIKAENGEINLSGIDTQIKRIIEASQDQSVARKTVTLHKMPKRAAFAREIFEKLCDAMAGLIAQCAEVSKTSDILMTGGVASGRYIRTGLRARLQSKGINLVFGDESLSQDNAVGIALLGGKRVWG